MSEFARGGHHSINSLAKGTPMRHIIVNRGAWVLVGDGRKPSSSSTMAIQLSSICECWRLGV